MEQTSEFFIQLALGQIAAGGLGAAVPALLAAAAAVIFLRMSARVLFQRQGRAWAGTFGAVEMGMAAGLIALFAMLMSASAKAPGGAPDEIGVGSLVTGGLVQAGLCAAILAVLIMRRHPIGRIMGLNAMPFGRQMAWSFFFLAASLPLMDLLSRVSISLHGGEPAPQAIVDFARSVESPEGQMAVILFAVIVAPVTEEFLFRGFLYPALKSSLGPFFAIMLSSALFGMIHMNAQAALPLGALGFVMALAYERTGSLLAPMTVHAMFNAASLVVMRLPEGPAPF